MKKIIYTLALALFSLGLMAQNIAPDFTITDTNGNSYQLYEELNKGKTVVIDFFGLSCGSCQTDMATLELVWQNHGAENGNLWIWAYETYGGSDYEVNDFVTINGGTFPSFSLNPQDSLLKKFQVTYVPSYFVICPNGYVKSCSIQNLDQYISSCATLENESVNKETFGLNSIYSAQGSDLLHVNFSIMKPTSVSIEFYDLLGNQIDLHSQYYPKGSHHAELNRSRLTPGYYFIRFTNRKDFVETRRIVLK